MRPVYSWLSLECRQGVRSWKPRLLHTVIWGVSLVMAVLPLAITPVRTMLVHAITELGRDRVTTAALMAGAG